MPSDEQGSFDLTPVIQLLHSLYPSGDELSPDGSSDNHSEASYNAAPEEDDRSQPELGNFDKLWGFLGRPLDAPPPAIVHISNNGKDSVPHGARTLVEKAVRWRDETGDIPLEDTEEFDSAGSNTKRYKGSAKKRQYMKKRDELRALRLLKEAKVNGIVTGATTLLPNDIGSESELPDVQKAHKRRSVIRRMLYDSSMNVEETLKTGATPKKGSKLPNTTPSGLDGWPISDPYSFSLTPEPVDEQAALAKFAAKVSRLVTKLHDKFVDERPFLRDPSLLMRKTTLNDTVSFGVHIFVDASNVSFFPFYNMNSCVNRQRELNLIDYDWLSRRS